MKDHFDDLRKYNQHKRASNREKSQQLLVKHGVTFTIHNSGAHLIVHSPEGLIDFWPGTGKWIIRGKADGRGVFNLLKRIGVSK